MKEDPCPLCLRSGNLNVLQVTDDDRVVLDTLLIMPEILNLTDRSGITYEEHLSCQGEPMSSMPAVRNPYCPESP